MSPHRIDCGFRNTRPEPVQRRRQPLLLSRRRLALRQQQVEQRADRESDHAHAQPERGPCKARGDGGPHHELTGRSAGHAEHLGGTRQRRGPRGREVLGGDVDGADQREHAASALQDASQARGGRVARGEQQRADAHDRRADRNHAARSEPIERDAGHQAEGRVAVVEEADQRRDAQRLEPEGLRQLRHHHARRRPQHVLVEVVDDAITQAMAAALAPLLIAMRVARAPGS